MNPGTVINSIIAFPSGSPFTNESDFVGPSKISASYSDPNRNIKNEAGLIDLHKAFYDILHPGYYLHQKKN